MAVELSAVPSLADVSEAEWTALTDRNDPFTQYKFLRLLETSGSVGPRTGWQPCHVLLRDSGELLAALPLYVKDHSYGEFIFDFSWAQAAMRAGISYYPKLVSAVPLTPATGHRLLVRADQDRASRAAALLDGARSLMHKLSASSLHLLFCRAEEAQLLETLGLAARRSMQYHLTPPDGLQTFADYQAALRNSSRKQVRREREQARAHGLALSMRPWAALNARDVAAMWRFYNSTIDNHGSQAYLTESFFTGLAPNPYAFAAMAHDGDQPVAGALFFVSDKAMYGRYWGADRELPMLHFELCYYFPIEWGLARGVRHFEAGAQGEHKIKRGFLPTHTYSAHLAAHPGLQRAIAEFVQEERSYVEREIAMLSESTPFKRGGE